MTSGTVHKTDADPGGAAVLVIDVQNDFCHADGVFAQAGLVVPDLEGVVDGVNRLVTAGRARGLPIIWLTMSWANDAEVGLLANRSPFLAAEGLREGTWGVELVAGLDVAEDDRVITKTRFSSFYRTSLAEYLDQLGVSTLLIGGVRTDFCVESTVRDAFFRDYRAVVVRDAVAGYFPDLHENSLREMGTVFATVASTASEAVETALQAAER